MTNRGFEKLMKHDKCSPHAVSLLVILLSLLILPAFAADTTTTDNPNNVTINLTAKDIAFNTSTITVPAGANVTINFNNMDSGVEHNFALYETVEAMKPIFAGDDITGPSKIVYNFEAPVKAGTYIFRCDDHPGQMKGNFIVQ